MKKFEALIKSIKSKRSLAVLLSGGLDSSLLALAAKIALKENSIAINVLSPITPSHEKGMAENISEEIGIDLLTVEVNELDDEVFSSNPPERCYICRKKRHSSVKRRMEGIAYRNLADGVNFDDLSDYRPGIKAADEDAIWHPLAELSITKQEIHEIARELNLSVWNNAPSPCLCTRFEYGMELNLKALETVDTAETYIRNLSGSDVRLRCFKQGIAVVETENFKSILNYRKEISDMLFRSGFKFACLDIEGFKSGKMNRLLSCSDQIQKGGNGYGKISKKSSKKDCKARS